ncbi:MAG: metal-dependent transcriptional regulator [Candidatus Melainabacteria bacterium]|nr:MAG: metal-dependent transcriptional regulator [Candidatus Melainabacteria bacterium]
MEDYLEAIYLIIEEKQAVKVVEIARFLNVGRSSVTEALKSLASKGLVNYGRYDVLTLTSSGEKIAKKVIKNIKFYITSLKMF